MRRFWVLLLAAALTCCLCAALAETAEPDAAMTEEGAGTALTAIRAQIESLQASIDGKKAQVPQGYGALDYRAVAASPHEFVGRSVVLTGCVIMAAEENGYGAYHIATLGERENVVLAARALDGGDSVGVGDTVTVRGKCAGLIPFETETGGILILPGVLVEEWERP